MATLEKIRTKAGVLVAVIIGLALLAFILGDLLSSKTSLFTSSQYELAKIGGKSISIQDFQQKVESLEQIYKLNSGQNSLDENTSESIREQTWQQMIEQYVLIDNMKDIGVDVSSDELFDMVQGKNPHPIIRQLFTNPQTGELNKAGLLEFLKTMDQDASGERKAFWLYIENQITHERILSKYNALIQKGLFVTRLQAKADFIESNKKANFSFISIPYSSIPDKMVSYTKSDLKKYYKAHKYLFEQEDSRDIEYVTFQINPSPIDIKESKDYIDKVKPDFETAQDLKQFVNVNSDVPFDEKFYKKSELSDSIANFVFKSNGIMGPFIEDQAFKLVKVVKKEMIPDSVKARHILIRPQGQTQEAVASAKALADSLKKAIEKGADFAALAKKYSADGTREKGGDLGWFTASKMVKPFSDFCFQGKKGELKVIETNYGYHVVQITDKGAAVEKVQVAQVIRKINPSQTTYREIFAKANNFAGNNRTYDAFIKAIAQQRLVKRIANNLLEGDKQIAGIQSPREVIKWAYDSKTKKYDVSTVFEADNQFVVAALTSVKKKGFAPLEDVENEIIPKVIQEKKGELISANINNKKGQARDINQLASLLRTQVQSATDVTFSAFAIPVAGIEPKLIATATNYPVNKLSAPIAGNNGVYVIQVTTVSQPSGIDFKGEQSKLSYMYQTRANYEPYEALKKLANIVDKRWKFY